MPRLFIFVSALALICMSQAAQSRTDKLAAVFTDPLPVATSGSAPISVHGVLLGRPFEADGARINSYSLVLIQKHKLYARVVLNFSALQKVPAGQEFFSKGQPQPRIEVYQRLKNGDKLASKTYSAGEAYALHVKFAGRKHLPASDTTAGAVVLRFNNGDYVEGTFVAKQSPRIIWDDEAIAQ